MKIALTADLHLTDRKKHPGRFKSLENILNQCLQTEVSRLIIAGDLFDAKQNNFSDFEKIVKNEKYSGLEIHLIPGNHDYELTAEKISAENVRIYSKAEWLRLKDDWLLLFVPFQKGKIMGEVLQDILGQSIPEKWILIGHGDWYRSQNRPNMYEPGVYMPLTQKDVNLFRPKFVFFGHIHKQLMGPQVYYPGSPSALDITETGYRHFLIFDTRNSNVEARRVETDLIYFDEELLVFPLENEAELLLEQINQVRDSWKVEKSDEHKICARIKVTGYSSDRSVLQKIIKEGFSGITLYEDVDISEVSFVYDPEKNYLLKKTLLELNILDLRDKPDMPLKNHILSEALRLIFEE